MITPTICKKYQVSFEHIKYDELVAMYQNYNNRDIGIISLLLYNSNLVIEELRTNYIFLEHIKNDINVLNFEEESDSSKVKEIESILDLLIPRIEVSEQIYYNSSNLLKQYLNDYFSS